MPPLRSKTCEGNCQSHEWVYIVLILSQSLNNRKRNRAHRSSSYNTINRKHPKKSLEKFTEYYLESFVKIDKYNRNYMNKKERLYRVS